MTAAGTFSIRDVTIGRNVVRVGVTAGAPGSSPLLAFNGIGASLELLEGFARELGTLGIGVIAFDVPGVGGSSAAPFPYRLPWLARLANRVLAKLDVAGTVDVIGVSWGGAVAQEFAHRYPARVRRLILAATTAGAFAVPGRLSVLSKMIGPRRYVDRAYMRRVGPALYGGSVREHPEVLEQFGTALRAPGTLGYSYQLLAVAGWTSALWLPRLRAPTLVMTGRDDPIVPPVNGRLLAALIPKARLVIIDDGHLFLLTSAATCAPIIADFLGGGHAARSA